MYVDGNMKFHRKLGIKGMYLLKGRPEIDPHIKERVVDFHEDLEVMRTELRGMRRNHPLWKFWIELEPMKDIENDQVPKSVRLQSIV